jgi:hypothetical protein
MFPSWGIPRELAVRDLPVVFISKASAKVQSFFLTTKFFLDYFFV